MPRTCGYAPAGERCFGIHNRQAKGRTDAAGALPGNGLLTVTLFVGTVDSDVFYARIRQDLLPKLPESSVVVMDNASFHKRQDIQEAVKTAGHLPEYMPVYSPDLNPTEHKRAQAKALRRKHRCSVDELFQRYKLQSVYIAPAIPAGHRKNQQISIAAF
ncbi:MAG: transposase [Gammaproteobacteria bacterium]|nr:transposase [Gammaproteobacteria bacterium]